MYHIAPIKDYILFLKNKCGLSVSLHPTEEEYVILPSELMAFNFHDNSYCAYVKTFPQAWRHCTERQPEIAEKCKNGSFCGVCYAGVKEYVYPITDKGKTAGFICVTGYGCENAESYLKSVSKKYSVPFKNLREIYGCLQSKMPDKSEVDVLIMPLCRMLELAYLTSEAAYKKEVGLIDQMIRYIKLYHAQNLTLEDLCRHFSCSRSHISHSFKKLTGQSFREYLTDVRLEKAKALLRYSGLSVTEIAFSVGFNDSNYFSNVFKKREGLSPVAYRKLQKNS